MEVVFYQIFIAATIVATNYFKRESLLLVCGFLLKNFSEIGKVVIEFNV